MSAPSSPSSLAVRIFVVFGAIAALFSTIILWRLGDLREQELIRYQGCANGARRDCDPSLFWMIGGLVNPSAGGLQVAQNEDPNGKRVRRTSENAPLLTSLRPEGFEQQGQGYHVETGAKIVLSSTIEQAKRVEVRFAPSQEGEGILIQAMEAVKDKDNTYSASFTWTETRSGDLEIRAYGESDAEQTVLLIPVTVTVAKTQ